MSQPTNPPPGNPLAAPCRACGALVSQCVSHCPSCGHPTPGQERLEALIEREALESARESRRALSATP